MTAQPETTAIKVATAVQKRAINAPPQVDTYIIRASVYLSYLWVFLGYAVFNLAPSALPVETIQSIIGGWGYEADTQGVVDGIIFYGTVFSLGLAVLGTKQMCRVSAQPGVDNTKMIHAALAVTVAFAIIFAISIFARLVIWAGVMNLSPWIFIELSSMVFVLITYVSYRTVMTCYEINSNTLKRTIDNSGGEL